jgi:hypothetical protein
MRSHGILSIVLFALLVMTGFSNTAFSAPGCLDIMSDPEGVDIYINGRHEGKTPLTCLGAPAGEVTIEAKKKGYDSVSKTVIVKPDDITSIKIQLQSSKEATGKGQFAVDQDLGSLVIFNLLGQVDVYIDGEKKGRGSLAVADIPTGNHDLKVGSFSKQIMISKNHKLKVKADKAGITVLNAPEEEKKAVSRPVAARDGRFIKYADGIMKDTKTGLEWIPGPDRNMTWLQARDWVKGLSMEGGGWRMPTVKELEGLFQKGKGTRNMTPLLKTTGWWVWAVERKDSHSAGYFDFYVGSKILDLRISNHPRAFAVRSP